MFKKSKTIEQSNDQSGPFIEIELYNDFSFVAGSPLEGCVHLNTDVNLVNTEKVTI